MMLNEPKVSVTFYAYFPDSKQFKARALAMELGLEGLITQVSQTQKAGPWCVNIYFRCIPHSREFNQAARTIQGRIKVWGGPFDGWEYPLDDVEVDCPGDWQDVELYPIETLVANSATYQIKIEPM